MQQEKLGKNFQAHKNKGQPRNKRVNFLRPNLNGQSKSNKSLFFRSDLA